MALLTDSMIEDIRQVADEYSAREHQRRLNLSSHGSVRSRAAERGRAHIRVEERCSSSPQG